MHCTYCRFKFGLETISRCALFIAHEYQTIHAVPPRTNLRNFDDFEAVWRVLFRPIQRHSAGIWHDMRSIITHNMQTKSIKAKNCPTTHFHPESRKSVIPIWSESITYMLWLYWPGMMRLWFYQSVQFKCYSICHSNSKLFQFTSHIDDNI